MENLVRPCSLLRYERKQRRERQEEAAAAAHRAECWKEDFMKKMEALERSKASNFLEVISAELRQRRWKIVDIFRDVDRGKSGALSEWLPLSSVSASLGQKLNLGSHNSAGYLLASTSSLCMHTPYRG